MDRGANRVEKLYLSKSKLEVDLFELKPKLGLGSLASRVELKNEHCSSFSDKWAKVNVFESEIQARAWLKL